MGAPYDQKVWIFREPVATAGLSHFSTMAASPNFGLNLGALTGASSAALTSLASSICCIGPLAITLLGVNGAILGAAIKPYRPFLLTVAAVLLAFAYWRVKRSQNRAEGAVCSIRAMRVQKTVLRAGVIIWIAAVGVGYAADQYWL